MTINHISRKHVVPLNGDSQPNLKNTNVAYDCKPHSKFVPKWFQYSVGRVTVGVNGFLFSLFFRNQSISLLQCFATFLSPWPLWISLKVSWHHFPHLWLPPWPVSFVCAEKTFYFLCITSDKKKTIAFNVSNSYVEKTFCFWNIKIYFDFFFPNHISSTHSTPPFPSQLLHQLYASTC